MGLSEKMRELAKKGAERAAEKSIIDTEATFCVLINFVESAANSGKNNLYVHSILNFFPGRVDRDLIDQKAIIDRLEKEGFAVTIKDLDDGEIIISW